MKRFSLILLLAVLLCGCVSTKRMQKEMNELKSGLFYELTSPEYVGEVHDSIYLDFIGYSNIDYYSTVKKKGSYLVPLLIINFQGDNFRTKLGEFSLNQTYREFLTDALLTECNSSTCFQLVDNKDYVADTTQVYRLQISVVENETQGRVRLQDMLILIPNEFIEVGNGTASVRPAATKLSLRARLSKGCETLLDKTYSIAHEQSKKNHSYVGSYQANQACLDDMAESLSLATKQVVENISQELNLIMSAKAQLP